MATRRVTAKRFAAKKVAAKKSVTQKTAAKKTAAKKVAPATTAGPSVAGIGTTAGIGIGSVVMFTSGGTSVGPGRLCGLHGIGNACVMFGDGIGCQRVAADLLSLAPVGSTAPACDGCDDC